MFLEGQTGSEALGLQHMMGAANILRKSVVSAYPKARLTSSLTAPAAKTRALLKKLSAGSSKVIGVEVDKGFGVRAMGVRMARE